MGELELVGLHEDGEHLVLVAPDGARFRVRIDEPLRAAVRRDRPQLEQLRAESAGTLSPREIQARIRAGATTQEVADSAGLPVERVRRYEGPVLAEREHVAEQARGTRVGRDVGSPTLGDLVTDRLAARGVDLASLAWDSARDASGPWVVLARFAVGDAEHEARWTFDLAKRTVVADEDEARWLSETELPDEPVSRRHLAAVRDVVFDFQGDGTPAAPRRTLPAAEPEPEPVPDPQAETASLLDDLRSRRGVRQAVELGRRRHRGVRGLRAAARVRLRTAGRRGARRAPAATPTPRPRPWSTRRRSSVPEPVTTPRLGGARGRRASAGARRVAPRCPAGTRSSSARSPNSQARQMLELLRGGQRLRARRGRPGGGGRHPAHVVPTAQHLVPDLVGTGLDVADDDLLALDHHRPADGAGVVGGPCAAPAQRLTCSTSTRSASSTSRAAPGNSRARKSVGDAEREHVDPELVDHPGQLLDLLGGVELRLVADEVVDRAARACGARRRPPRSPSSRRPRGRCCVSPSREEIVAAPARSCRVKSTPARPRAAWLWCIWSASVDLPQSMVPEKKTSSAIRPPPRRGRASRGGSATRAPRPGPATPGVWRPRSPRRSRVPPSRPRRPRSRAATARRRRRTSRRRTASSRVTTTAAAPSRRASGRPPASRRRPARGAGAARGAPPRPARRRRRARGRSPTSQRCDGRRRPCRGRR